MYVHASLYLSIHILVDEICGYVSQQKMHCSQYKVLKESKRAVLVPDPHASLTTSVPSAISSAFSKMRRYPVCVCVCVCLSLSLSLCPSVYLSK
jgi:hypothetical protein